MTDLPAISPDLPVRLRAAERVAVPTGAGISAESGIPTFRDAQNGPWARYRPEELASPEGFRADPRPRVRRVGAVAAIAWLLAAVASPIAPARAGGRPESEFTAWVAAFRAEAKADGISEATLEAALAGLEPIPRVIELDRRQPELTLTLEAYLARVVPDTRVTEGRRRLAEHETLLAGIAGRYGVEPRFLVAIWGVETDFGRDTGGFPVIAALATLAWDGRRREFFRGQLLDALHILEEGSVEPSQMMGSWAGAMGQPQFMPSSFRRFAVDFDGDGRRDIWGTPGDVFASAANYLARAGWAAGHAWGREVRLPGSLGRGSIGLKVQKRLGEWRALGVRLSDGGGLPESPEFRASLIQPDGPGTRAFVIYENFRALLRWNRSELFGIAVGVLADRVGTAP